MPWGHRFLGLQAGDHLTSSTAIASHCADFAEYLHDRAVDGLDDRQCRGIALDEHQCGLVVAHRPDGLGEGRAVQLETSSTSSMPRATNAFRSTAASAWSVQVTPVDTRMVAGGRTRPGYPGPRR